MLHAINVIMYTGWLHNWI